MGKRFLIKMSEKGGVVEIPLERYTMSGEPKEITLEEVTKIGDSLGINWKDIDADELLAGTKHEAEEHPSVIKNSTQAVQVAYDHLKEIPDYYTRLKTIEADDETISVLGDKGDLPE